MYVCTYIYVTFFRHFFDFFRFLFCDSSYKLSSVVDSPVYCPVSLHCPSGSSEADNFQCLKYLNSQSTALCFKIPLCFLYTTKELLLLMFLCSVLHFQCAFPPNVGTSQCSAALGISSSCTGHSILCFLLSTHF